MDNVQISQFNLNHPKGRVDRVAFISCDLKANNPKGTLDFAVNKYVLNEVFNQFIEIDLDNPWLRLIIKDINELNFVNKNFEQFNDVEVFEQELINKNGNKNGRIAILRGGLKSEKPIGYMNEVVRFFVGPNLSNQFIEIYLDNPWVRVIIFDINKIEYKIFKNQTINDKI